MDRPTIRVLLIEDTTMQARTVKHLLSTSKNVHFKVEWANTLADGLRNLAQNDFDVVLSDLQLHDSYGIGTFHRVQDQNDITPVVLLTNLDDDVLIHEALSSGAQDYLLKSQIDAKSLIRSLRHAIERHKLFCEMKQRYEQRIRELSATS